MTFSLRSSAFKEGEMIPAKYTCDGKNISIPLDWSGAPARVKSYALINDDPDCAGEPFVHWLIYNIPGHRNELPEKFPLDSDLPDGTLQGMNDFGKIGYGGPCPPSGTHRYYFTLFALDLVLPLHSKMQRKDLDLAIQTHVLGRTQMMGTYRRP